MTNNNNKNNNIEVNVLSLPEVTALIREKFADVVEPLPEQGEQNSENHLEYKAEPAALVSLCRELKAAGYGFLADITAVDYLEQGIFRLLYQICNFKNADSLTLKVDIPREEPVVDSLCSVWPAANWPEREVYDMFGIVFKGHPQMERILMWEGFEGWPLRRDYVHQPSKYQGRRRLD